MVIVEKAQEITKLSEELKTYKNFINKCLHCTISTEDNSSILYNEKIEELGQLLQSEEKKGIALTERLADAENQYQEIKDILKVR